MRTPLARLLALVVVFAAAPVAAHAQIAVLSNNVEEHIVTPGEHYTGRMVISNASSDPQTVRLYQTDYSFQADGTSDFGDAGTHPRSNAKWITLQTERVTVPGGAEVTVPYSVNVPAGDSLVGSYWSDIMVEGATAPPPALTQGAKPQLGLGTVIRYSIQVATHIGTTGTRTVKFDSVTASRTDKGNASFDLNVIDTGERGYRPLLWIEVYDSTGALRGTAKQQRGLLYPKTSLHQHFDLGALPAGSYKAIVFADSGDEAVFAGQFNIKY